MKRKKRRFRKKGHDNRPRTGTVKNPLPLVGTDGFYRAIVASLADSGLSVDPNGIVNLSDRVGAKKDGISRDEAIARLKKRAAALQNLKRIVWNDVMRQRDALGRWS